MTWTKRGCYVKRLTVVSMFNHCDRDKKAAILADDIFNCISGDRWIPRTKGQYRDNVSTWWRHHVNERHGKQ